jgi:hypothetical protein
MKFSPDDIAKKELECGVFGPFCQQKWLSRAPDHVKRELEKGRRFKNIRAMSRQGFLGMDVNDLPPASFTAVTASATETNLWTPNIWTPIPANDMRAGKIYLLRFGGIFTSTGTQGVLTWTLRCGQSATPASNVSLGASNATAPPASLTNAPFFGEAFMGIRSLGIAASGATAVGHMTVNIQGAAAATSVDYIAGGSVPTTIDNTAATGLIASLTISVASQSYQCQWCAIMSLN